MDEATINDVEVWRLLMVPGKEMIDVSEMTTVVIMLGARSASWVGGIPGRNNQGRGRMPQ